MSQNILPRLLIIDDLYGRTLPESRNEERENLCGQFLLGDISEDEIGKGIPQCINEPIAQVVFYRGQYPSCAKVGDSVENDLAGILKMIESGWLKQPYWSLVLLDLCFYTGRVTEPSNKRCKGMPECRAGDDDPKQYFGLQILSALRETMPDVPVVILSSKPEEGITLDYTKMGALGFIARAEKSGPEQLKEHLYKNALITDDTGNVLGKSKSILTVLRSVRRANGNSNLLLRGEMGTGKGLFASYAHNLRNRILGKELPYKVVNCPEMSTEMFANELFGHQKGAYTGADKDSRGIIEEAKGGDVFLDEIAELPLTVQAGILKVIEERAFKKVGKTKTDKADVRFLSATNSSLVGFREDLFRRLTEAGTITLPPLRDRKDDIPMLAERFVRELEKKLNARERTVQPETFEFLKRYSWPGNVRQLQQVLQNAVQHYSKLPHLIPEHIVFDDLIVGPLAAGDSCNTVVKRDNPPADIYEPFTEYKLPLIIKEQNSKLVNYVVTALETNSDKRSSDPSYPKTWYAMTGQDLKKESTRCQRNIGEYLVRLEVEDLFPIMVNSVVIRKAVIQCSNKIDGAKTKLASLIEKLFLELDDELLFPLIKSKKIKKIISDVMSENFSNKHHLTKRLKDLERKINDSQAKG